MNCRRLSNADAAIYRPVLLEALTAHPAALAASAEDEAALSAEDFARRFDANVIFGSRGSFALLRN